MARSLTVEPEEHVTTSRLLLAFLALAAVLLMVGMVAGAWSADATEPAEPVASGAPEGG